MTPSTQAVFEAETARLAEVYLRVKALAQRRRMELEQAGAAAEIEEMVTAADWVLVKEAMGLR